MMPYMYGRQQALQGCKVGPVTHQAPSAATWTLYARELGHRLVKARQARGLSQARVAHAAGISTYTYQKYEKGESRPGTPANPRLVTLVALCQVLQVAVEDLLPPDPPDVTGGR